MFKPTKIIDAWQLLYLTGLKCLPFLAVVEAVSGKVYMQKQANYSLKPTLAIFAFDIS